MSNNKQSSIEQLESDLKIWFAFVRISFPTEIENSINRAKKKHKEETIDALLFGDVLSLNTAETYYKVKFGGNK